MLLGPSSADGHEGHSWWCSGYHVMSGKRLTWVPGQAKHVLLAWPLSLLPGPWTKLFVCVFVGPYLGSAQDFFLALCLEITFDGIRRALCDFKDHNEVRNVHGKSLNPYTLSKAYEVNLCHGTPSHILRVKFTGQGNLGTFLFSVSLVLFLA